MNNSGTYKSNKKLTLMVNAGGMFFCCTDMLTGYVTAYKHLAFTKFKAIDEELWRAFINNTELTRQYDEVLVLHNNSFCTFVPETLFNSDNAGAYLQYNTKVFESDFFAYDFIEFYGLYNVHVPLVNVNNFLIDQFGGFEYKNTNSILVKKLLDASKTDEAHTVYVHIQNSHFEIVVIKNKSLQLFNSFEYSTPEDFLYYTLFTLEQLGLDTNTCQVILLGIIDTESPLYKLAYTYIKNIDFLDTKELSKKLNTGAKETSENFILFTA